MLDFLLRGGPVMIPLALCSILASVITFERILALRRSKVVPREILHVAEAADPKKDLSVAISVCERNPGVFSDILRAGLEAQGLPWETVRDVILDAGRQETPKLERNLVWLETIAGVAPLLGLLGTVLGMIKTFASISVAGLGDPQVLSEGISEAMITTAVGLGIGIPTLVAYNLLAARSEAFVIEIERHASRLLARWRSRRAEAGAEVEA
ncbi:MAG TPA: MotA/TolQ/ExbB proton channel family protein [Candidatus Krumholzibacteria bacterium]|nr:MotA/TolQ/ExbB proton channel family protein [Candidatus Krumholzibacteria bacterium]